MRKTRRMAGTSEAGIAMPALYDKYLLLAAFGLVAIGLLMVTSSSIVISNRVFGHSFHFLIRQGVSVSIGLALAIIAFRLPMSYWEKWGGLLLLASIVMLALVLVPGIGREVNGSRRWIHIGPFGLQVSEFVKLAVIAYLAGYLVRRQEEVRTQMKGFIKPLILLGIIALLLLKEPDFGATSVIMATALGMMFLAGVRLWQFALLMGSVLAALAILAVSSPYRLERLTTFLNPWANQFDSGYQLTQSLIAFGRGGWLGVGLGDSVQKLFYLPEAHTDFLFAVLAEELGLVGVLVVMSLFALLIARAFIIARHAQELRKNFSAYFAYGLALWLGMQAMINIGVNAGVLPTKGLTLPLMSYGGGSMIVCCIVIGLLLRIDYENRMMAYGLSTSSKQQKVTRYRTTGFYR